MLSSLLSSWENVHRITETWQKQTEKRNMCAPVSFKVSRKHLLRRLFWHHVRRAARSPSASPVFQITFPFQKVGGKREQRKENKSSGGEPANMPAAGGEAGFHPAWTTFITQRQRRMGWRSRCSARADGQQLGLAPAMRSGQHGSGFVLPHAVGWYGVSLGWAKHQDTPRPGRWLGVWCTCWAAKPQWPGYGFVPSTPLAAESSVPPLLPPALTGTHALHPQASDGRSRVACLLCAHKKPGAWALWAKRRSLPGCLAARLSDTIRVFPGARGYQHWLYAEGPGNQREHLWYLGLPPG